MDRNNITGVDVYERWLVDNTSGSASYRLSDTTPVLIDVFARTNNWQDSESLLTCHITWCTILKTHTESRHCIKANLTAARFTSANITATYSTGPLPPPI